MSDTLIFCTCAQHNYNLYLARIDQWYKHVSKIPADYMVVVDGRLPEDQISKRQHLKFIQHQNKLTMCRHAGWKRSIVTALENADNYTYIAHIQNDVVIFNPQRVQSLIRTGQSVSGYVQDGDYMQTAIMTLSDRKLRNTIKNYYTTQNLYNSQITQRRFQSFTDWKFMFKGSNIGIKGRNMSIQTKIKYLSCLDIDYWGQFYSYGFQLVRQKLVWTGRNMK